MKSLLKPPLHPFPEEMLRDRGHTGVFRGVFHALRWRWRYPEPTQASSPAKEDGEKLGIQPSFHTLPRQEPEEDLLYKAKFLLGKTLRDLLFFILYFFSLDLW